MRQSQAFIPTLKEDPADAELISHKLMVRAGMLRKLAAGIYTILPLGWRVTRKVAQIVREEMDRAGCQELLLPILMPAELWKETGRWVRSHARGLRRGGPPVRTGMRDRRGGFRGDRRGREP